MKNLQKIREEFNTSRANKKEEITKTKLAEAAHVSKSTICRCEQEYETYLKKTTDILKAYSESFDVSLEYLIYDDVKAKQSCNYKISAELGLTDEAIETLKLAKKMSDSVDLYDISAVINATIGNSESTIGLMQAILNYLMSQQHGNDIYATATLSTIFLKYVDDIIKPQLKEVIDNLIAEDERVSNMEAEYMNVL